MTRAAASFDKLDFETVFDALDDEIVVLDAKGVIVAANESWRRFCRENDGDTETFYVGTNYLRTCDTARGPSSSEASLIRDGFDQVMQRGQPFYCEYPCDSPTLKRWFGLTVTRVFSGEEPLAVFQHRNITTRVQDREELAKAHVHAETLAAVVAHSNDAILSYDLDCRIVTWNHAAEEMYGYTAEEIVGQRLDRLYPPDWPHSIEHYRDEIIAGRLKSFEATRVAKDGTARVAWVTCAPIRGADGRIALISNIHRDVTEIRRAEEARDIIAGEVVHRAKNLLTIVNAIQRQTARSSQSLEDFTRVFGGRIQSLANSIDLLVSGNWTTVPVERLIEVHLGTFGDRVRDIVTWRGPNVLLRPDAVQVLGMALHELGTNATKYGALTDPPGRIEIDWDIVHVDEKPQLDLSWKETGISITRQPDPPGGPPGRGDGFGHSVLTDLPRNQLQAVPVHDIGSDRIEWRIAIPSIHFDVSVDASSGLLEPASRAPD